MTENIPQTSDDITIRHTIAHYTILPFSIVVLLSMISCIPLFLLGYIGPSLMFLLTWLIFSLALAYIHVFGDYVIPGGTYRRVKRGEYDD